MHAIIQTVKSWLGCWQRVNLGRRNRKDREAYHAGLRWGRNIMGFQEIGIYREHNMALPILCSARAVKEFTRGIEDAAAEADEARGAVGE